MEHSLKIVAVCGSLLCYQMAPRELAVVEFSANTTEAEKVVGKVLLDPEVPSTGYLVSLSAEYAGVWFGNKGCFQKFAKSQSSSESAWIYRSYMGTVSSGLLNNELALALLTDGRVFVHSMDRERANGAWLPKSKAPATAIALLDGFALLCSADGTLQMFKLPDCSLVASVEHSSPITRLVAQPLGHGIDTILLDKQGNWYMFMPLSERLFSLSLPKTIEHVAWATRSVKDTESTYYVASSSASMHLYAFVEHSIHGPMNLPLGETAIPSGCSSPLLFLSDAGKCVLQTGDGQQKVAQLTSYTSHAQLTHALSNNDSAETGKLLQRLYLLQDNSGLQLAFEKVKTPDSWQMLANTALSLLDLDFLARIRRRALELPYTQKLDPDFLASIKESRSHLAGHVALYFEEFELAEQLFQQSEASLPALVQLKSQMGKWQEALKLAEQHALDLLPKLLAAYAGELEASHDFVAAQDVYKQALHASNKVTSTSEAEREELDLACSAGLTRTTLQLGETVRGLKMLKLTEDKQLLKECGLILERLNQPKDAASLYERAEAWEKVILLLISAGEIDKAEKLLEEKYIEKPENVMRAIGARCTELQNYDRAIGWYVKCNAHELAVRVVLDYLHDIERAEAIVRQSHSIEGARLVIQHFLKLDRFADAVEFCALAGLFEEALQFAMKHGQCEHLAKFLVKNSSLVNSNDTWLRLASVLQSSSVFYGLALLHAGDQAKGSEALSSALSVGNIDGVHARVMELIGSVSADNDALFLAGIENALSRPPLEYYRFQFLVSLERYKDAAVVLKQKAEAEKEAGNFRKARDLLRDGYMQFRDRREPFPAELMEDLLLLHSYLLMKILAKINAHQAAGWLSLRIAESIEAFGKGHRVGILAFAALQCYKIKLGQSALKFAGVLMQSEYRAQLSADLLEKLEYVINNPIPSQAESPETPCPMCKKPLPILSKRCGSCFAGAKTILPFCVATGVHMSSEGASFCPNCQFPALWQPFLKLLNQTESVCPMCTESTAAEDVKLCGDPAQLFQNFQSSVSGNF